MRVMAGTPLPLHLSRVGTVPVIGDLTRAALHTSRAVMVRALPWAGPFSGVLANAEERLYEHEKSLIAPQAQAAGVRSDLRQPFEMTAARRAAIERAAKASRLNLETHVNV
jgi:hypothetical protein